MKKVSDEELARDHHPSAIRQRLQEPPRLQYVSDAVLGGIDGCVTTFAVVSGAVGAGFSSTVALILGFANLFADGFSMAVSNYEAIKAQSEFAEGIWRTEEEHIEKVPDGEREEIRQIFEQKGFEGDVLNKIVDTITKDRRLWVETMLTEEYGIQMVGPSPMRSALTTFGAFLVVGTMPLLPLLAASLEMEQKYVLSAILAGVMFFLIGTLKSISFGKSGWKAGLSTLLTGGTAAGLAFLTGYLLRMAFDI